MTEWERQRELVEFDRASQLFKPMSFLMASRFHLAKFDDNVDDASLPADDAVCLILNISNLTKT